MNRQNSTEKMALSGHLGKSGDRNDRAAGPVLGNKMGRSAASCYHNKCSRSTFDRGFYCGDGDGVSSVQRLLDLGRKKS